MEETLRKRKKTEKQIEEKEQRQTEKEREKSERNVPFIRSAGQRSVPDPRNVNYIVFVYGHKVHH